MKKIGMVIFADMLRLRAESIHARNFLEGLRKNRIEFDVFFSGVDHCAPKIALIRLLKQFFGRIPLAARLFCKKSNYSFFYVRDWLFAYFLSILRVPYIFEINGLFVYEGLIRGYAVCNSSFARLLGVVECVVVRRARKLVCVSPGIKQYLVIRYKISSEKFLVARNAANRSVYHEGISPVSICARENSFLVGWLGSFDAYHGVYDIVEIADELRHRECRDIQFLIIGDGEGKKRMQFNIRERKLDDYFIFVGAQPWEAVPQYLINANVCLSLDKRTKDNLEYRNIIGVTTVKVFEYLALGKPVLAYDLGDAREFFEGQKIGWVCQPNPKDLAEKLLEIKKRTQEIKIYSENAARLSKEMYNWDIVVKKIVDFIFMP